MSTNPKFLCPPAARNKYPQPWLSHKRHTASADREWDEEHYDSGQYPTVGRKSHSENRCREAFCRLLPTKVIYNRRSGPKAKTARKRRRKKPRAAWRRLGADEKGWKLDRALYQKYGGIIFQ